MVRDHSRWFLRDLALDRNAVARSSCGIRAVRKEFRVTAMLYARYHGQILGLAIRSQADGDWKAKLREILAEFDNDCRDLRSSQPSA